MAPAAMAAPSPGWSTIITSYSLASSVTGRASKSASDCRSQLTEGNGHCSANASSGWYARG
jgi:hypothetical protein